MCSNAGSLPEGYTFDGSSLPSSAISWFRFCYTAGGKRDAKGARESLEGCSMSYMGNCEEYLQTAKSNADDLIEELTHINVQMCQRVCKEIYHERCTWFMFDRTSNDCKIFSGPINRLKEHCDEMGYLNGPSFEICDEVFEPESQNGCYNFREDYCRYDNSLIQNVEHIETLSECQDACKFTYNCTYFQFNKQEKSCKLNTDLASNRVCDIIHGTPEPNFQTCLDNGKVQWYSKDVHSYAIGSTNTLSSPARTLATTSE